MKDTEIWTNESDAYTQRALERLGTEALYPVDPGAIASQWPSKINQYHPDIGVICDIGCGYGLFIHNFLNEYPNAYFWGVDPGEASIALAQKHVQSERVTFQLGHSHELPIASDSCDLVVFNMVLQWIPRALLIQTFAEVDRILRVGGLVFIQDFLPFKPISSISRHNDNVRIFKNDYSAMLCAFPWFYEVDREVHQIERGESMQRVISLVRKAGIEAVYQDCVGAVEHHG